MPRCRSLLVLVAQAVASLLVLPSVAPASAQASRAVDLSPAWEQDTTRRYEYGIDSTLATVLMGQTQETKATMRCGVAVQATAVTSDGTTAQLTYERIMVRFEGGLAPGAFDSETPDQGDERYRRICEPLVDQTITLELAADGKITAVEGLDDFAPAGPDGLVFRQLFGEDAVRTMFQPLFRIKEPPAEARVGEVWTLERAGAKGLNLAPGVLELELERLRGRTASIRITAEPDVGVPGDLRALPGAKVTESTLRGTCLWDTQTRILRAMETTSTAKIEADARGMDVSMDVDARTQLKLID